MSAKRGGGREAAEWGVRWTEAVGYLDEQNYINEKIMSAKKYNGCLQGRKIT